MTCVVGILCTDGAVIGTDSSATFAHVGRPTIEQPSEKLRVVANRVVVAGTGHMGLGQRFRAIVEQTWKNKVFLNPPVIVAELLCRAMLEDFARTFIKPGDYGALIAFPTSDRVHLCEFDSTNFQPEFKTEYLWYCSMGSAQPITDPFLGLMREVYWQEGRPTVNEAVFAVTWALEHAISVNTGGVNGPARIAVLENKDKGLAQARILDDDHLHEARQDIEEAKRSLRQLRETVQADVPDAPRRRPR